MDLERRNSHDLNAAPITAPSNEASNGVPPAVFPFLGGMPGAAMFGPTPAPFAAMAPPNMLAAQMANPVAANWSQLAAGANMMAAWNPQAMAAAFTMASQMNVPVGGAKDEEILVRVLLGSYSSGKSFKQAIETELHGVNHHAANLWKDYFLDHHDHIYAQVSKLRETASTPQLVHKAATARRPIYPPESPISDKHGLKHNGPRGSYAKRSLPPKISDSISVGTANPHTKHKHESVQSPADAASAPVRAVKRPRFSDSRRSPKTARSPTPPGPETFVYHTNGKQRYSEADHEFFIKCITFELERNPRLSKTALCRILARKAPHHPDQGWNYYWNNCGDLPDTIFSAAKDRIPTIRAHGNDGKSSASEDESDEAASTGDEARSSSSTDRDERKMGPAGGEFTQADFRVIARYLAKMPDLRSRSQAEIWIPFHEKHDQRSYKSWAECYRRYRETIDALVEDFRERYASENRGGQTTYDEYLSRKRKPLSDTASEDEIDGRF
ncbi:hypothetical protein PUNSTDRAFT_48921 [Punctularia strigosozonata HHB-11173 SS5]|uniref:uncharacterized protein n=1 Tax=Punctularia strigosozonata (strain HHB-11173) TaxID=741275 RepID=UPI0004416C48|nr:uncharacterized protein PUNSTDRAFT_48921 [Punctularia strigosozonata HHB-11173 SS5]EIN14072.1 hypothetical protein PUNSTDRAFT_48921 [Punctularia strigosozonata HHB-11173 SS5]